MHRLKNKENLGLKSDRRNIKYGSKTFTTQNLIIYIGDVFGITCWIFLMSHIRFYPDIYGVWAQDNRVIYRWLVAIFVLTIVYLAIDPNQNFFKKEIFGKNFGQISKQI